MKKKEATATKFVKANDIKAGDRLILVEIGEDDAYHTKNDIADLVGKVFVAMPDGDGFSQRPADFVAGGFGRPWLQKTDDAIEPWGDAWVCFAFAKFKRAPKGK